MLSKGELNVQPVTIDFQPIGRLVDVRGGTDLPTTAWVKGERVI